MVKYPAMRESGSSTYFAERGDESDRRMGYSLCMLHAGGRAITGNYRDPYLLAITHELEPRRSSRTSSSPATRPTAPTAAPTSGAAFAACPGLRASPPPDARLSDVFAAACLKPGADDECRVAVPQGVMGERRIDTVDRIQSGAEILECSAAAGLRTASGHLSAGSHDL